MGYIAVKNIVNVANTYLQNWKTDVNVAKTTVTKTGVNKANTTVNIWRKYGKYNGKKNHVNEVEIYVNLSNTTVKIKLTRTYKIRKINWPQMPK